MKDKYYAFLDWLDKFRENKWKTHGLAAVCGAIVALYLRSLLK